MAIKEYQRKAMRRFPREIKDHDNLIEHCSECVAAELLRMGGNEV